MPKFIVTVWWKKSKEVSVFAKDEDDAEDKALELVSSWGVEDPEVVDVEEA